MSNFMKICPVGAQLFQADRRTDMTKLIVAFSPTARRWHALILRQVILRVNYFSHKPCNVLYFRFFVGVIVGCWFVQSKSIHYCH
jgi:hypothetical protein